MKIKKLIIRFFKSRNNKYTKKERIRIVDITNKIKKID